jgi:hypothetical protein
LNLIRYVSLIFRHNCILLFFFLDPHPSTIDRIEQNRQ